MAEFRKDIVAAREDVDELGHISNLVYVRWVLEIAREHSAAVGWPHDAYLAMGAVWVVRKHEIEYLRPVFAGDAVALVTWVDAWKGASSVRRTSIRSVAEGVEVARAATLWAFIDLEAQRPRRIPPDLRAAFD